MGKNKLIITCSIWGLLIALLTGGLFPLISAGQTSPTPLAILFTHDLHSNLQPFIVNTVDDQLIEAGGYARLAEAIKKQRQENPDGTMLVDAGDFSMGTLFHVLSPTEAPELRLMGKLGYEATTFGNHEFDFDTVATAQMLLAARKKGGSVLPELLASNLAVKPDSESGMKKAAAEYGIKDYMVVNKNGIRIGVFGLIGKDAVHDIIMARDIEFKDPQIEAKRVVRVLKEREKVDVIICLSHGGTRINKAKSEDELLAAAVPDIDVIISGHTHTLLTKPIVVGKTTIASAGCFGQNLGVIKLSCIPGQRPELADYQIAPITPQLTANQEINQDIEDYRKLVDSQFLSPYGYRFHQVVAESSYSMGSLDAMYQAAQETGLGDLVADAFRSAVQKAEGAGYQYVNVAVQPLGEIRNAFTAGNIEVKDVFRTLSLGLGTDKVPGYPVVAFYLTGSDIKNCLEIQSTLAPMQGNYTMQVSGINFKYNPNRLPLDRVYGVMISMPDGSYQPLEKKRLYRIATSYYAAALLGKMGPMTHGIVNSAPKSKTGQPLSDLSQALVDADNSRSGVQELKEWVALTQFLQAGKDSDKNGIANLPSSYQKPAGRYEAVASWNPYYLLVDSTKITWAAVAAGVSLILLLVLAVRAIRRRLLGHSRGSRAS
ncbi:MAG: bifunctional metallophosphatase/5'-nucleotidase [Methylocystaceae bacterium]